MIGFLWFYFIVSTVCTNICFLNILIAIVSDTYARITENKERFSLMQRTEIYADFIYIIKLEAKLTKYRYLYMVTPLGE